MKKLMLSAILGLVACWPSPEMASAQCTPTATLKTSVALAWGAPAQLPGITTTGYVLEKRVNGGNWVAFPTLAATTLSYTDSNLAPGTYEYRVSDTATGPGGMSGTSIPANPGTPPPCVTVTVVAAPTNLTASPQ